MPLRHSQGGWVWDEVSERCRRFLDKRQPEQARAIGHCSKLDGSANPAELWDWLREAIAADAEVGRDRQHPEALAGAGHDSAELRLGRGQRDRLLRPAVVLDQMPAAEADAS